MTDIVAALDRVCAEDWLALVYDLAKEEPGVVARLGQALSGEPDLPPAPAQACRAAVERAALRATAMVDAGLQPGAPWHCACYSSGVPSLTSQEIEWVDGRLTHEVSDYDSETGWCEHTPVPVTPATLAAGGLLCRQMDCGEAAVRLCPDCLGLYCAACWPDFLQGHGAGSPCYQRHVRETMPRERWAYYGVREAT